MTLKSRKKYLVNKLYPDLVKTYGEPHPKYFVYRQGGGGPVVTHRSRSRASGEAQRLAVKHPGQTFHVTKLKESFRVETSPPPEDRLVGCRVLIKKGPTIISGRYGIISSAPPEGHAGPFDVTVGKHMRTCWPDEFDLVNLDADLRPIMVGDRLRVVGDRSDDPADLDTLPEVIAVEAGCDLITVTYPEMPDAKTTFHPSKLLITVPAGTGRSVPPDATYGAETIE